MVFMRYRWLAISLLICSVFSQELMSMAYPIDQEQFPDQNQTKPLFCGKSPRSMRISARHIEGNGIGYNQGYTSLDGFFASFDPSDEYWVPFLDVRGHIFNNGKPAANAGVGVRYVDTSRVWGVNAYYDFRKTDRHCYSQTSLGFESLGQFWDFRLNGYLPIGSTKSSFYSAQFARFKEHYLILSRKREFALKGGNAEVGFHVEKIQNISFYFAGGPYYLEGEGKHAWGGEGRAVMDLLDHFRLEANTSYDHLFKWIAQGQISVRFPFGPKKAVKQREKGCSLELALWERALQRVDRNEIIATDKTHRRSVAINPTTKQPYFFWFVDNTSHSNGTFESPFNTLLAAQESSNPSDIIYVFSGDGTYTGMNQGIVLQNNQSLLGSGNRYKFRTTHGSIIVPALTSSLPLITNVGNPVITCANNNEIAGMHILTNGNVGISCTGIDNAFVHHNVLDFASSTGILIGTSSGNVTIKDNVINVLNSSNAIFTDTFNGTMIIANNVFNYDNSSDNFGIHLLNSVASSSSYSFSGNQFIAPLGAPCTGIELGQMGTAILDFNSLTISDNLFVGLGTEAGGGKPIGGFGFGGIGRVTLSNNLFSNVGAGTNDTTRSTVLLRAQAGSNLVISVKNNQWESSQDQTQASLNVINKDSSASVCVTLSDNQSDVIAGDTAYALDNTVGGTMTADVSNNVGTVTQTNTTPGVCP